MTLALGYIFSNVLIKKPQGDYDPLTFYQKNQQWENIKHAAMITAPAVVFHELAHKFTAMFFGAQATLHAPYGWYMIIILLKMMNFPLLFFVGGYVTHTPLPALPSALVAISGIATNIALWLAAKACVQYKLVHQKWYSILIPLGKINLFLAIFNMIPIPGFDGANAVRSIIQAIQ